MDSLEKSGKKKRSKMNEKDRNYICTCNKTYQSYPALYTHIKNKHDLEELNFYSKKDVSIINEGPRRGRPDKYTNKPLKTLSPKSERDENFIIILNEKPEYIKYIEQLINNFKCVILNTNEARLSKEYQNKQITKISKLYPEDEGLFKYMKDNSKETHSIFKEKTEKYGEKEWRLLMLLSHYRTFLKKKCYKLFVHIAYIAYSTDMNSQDNLNQILGENYSAINLQNTNGTINDLSRLAFDLSKSILNSTFQTISNN